MNTLADTIVRPGYTSLRYAEMLLKDVTPEMFARRPRLEGGTLVAINHPAFCLGHLTLYPAKVLGMCGLDASNVAAPQSWASLFEAGNDCQDDPDGTIYPRMDEITERFFAAHRHALEAIAKVPDQALVRENPAEGRMKEMFPTVAGAVNFMIGPHVMMHLGQISAWRRCFGLGPAM